MEVSLRANTTDSDWLEFPSFSFRFGGGVVRDGQLIETIQRRRNELISQMVPASLASRPQQIEQYMQDLELKRKEVQHYGEELGTYHSNQDIFAFLQTCRSLEQSMMSMGEPEVCPAVRYVEPENFPDLVERLSGWGQLISRAPSLPKPIAPGTSTGSKPAAPAPLASAAPIPNEALMKNGQPKAPVAKAKTSPGPIATVNVPAKKAGKSPKAEPKEIYTQVDEVEAIVKRVMNGGADGFLAFTKGSQTYDVYW